MTEPASAPVGDPIGRVSKALENPDVRFGAGVALGVFGFLLFVGVLYPAPLPILFLGAVLGSLSALVALGLVLVYRANRIINFSQGDLGGAAAVFAASLIVGPKWSYWPAVLVGFIAALIAGGLVDVLVIRRFAKAPRLVLTVATIGLAQVFQFVELGLPSLFDYDTAPQPPVPFKWRWDWFPVVFNAAHLLILVIVPLVAIGLGLFFRYTRIGVAIRASAESADRAALLGVPVKRVQTVVWVLAAGLSALAVLLRMPIQGVSIGAVLGPALLLRALAAAVIGRMENMRVTFFAAVVLGMAEQAVLWHLRRTLLVDAVLFVVILAALLLQRRGNLTRADDVGASTWSAIREVRPIPRELRGLPIVRYGVQVLAALGLVLLIFFPLRMSPSQVNLLGVGLILVMVVCSLVILTGWAGQISLGQAAIVAFGASAAGKLAQNGQNFFVCLVAAGLVGAIVAIAIGLPALRIRGLFLAVTTLAFAVAAGSYFLNREFFPWFVPQQLRVQRPVIFDKFDLETEHTYYFCILTVLLLVLGSLRALRNSRSGRMLVAVRDNARAAQAYSISPTRARIAAFGLSGFIAALAGGLFFFHQHNLPETLLRIETNLTFFNVAVLGGLGSVPGAIIGGAWQTFLNYSSFTDEPLTRLLASGLGVVIILLVLPAGLGGLLYDGRDALLRLIARRRNILVPSLLADVRVAEDIGATTGDHVGERELTGDELLVVRDVDVSYGRTQVLFGVNFHVNQGEIVALLGTNGAGKSTLLSAISGLVPPTSGRIHFEGKEITGAGPNATVGAGIVFMPGGKGVFPTLTVEENLKLAAWLFKKEPEYVEGAIEQVLGYFPILRRRWDQKAGNLSGGEQQMLTLAQAFISRPRLLMIDELSLGLAPVIVEQLLGIVRAIHANGTTVVLVEQSVNVAITLAERAVFMEKGEVRFDGPTSDLLDRPDILRAVFLKGAAAAQEAESPAALAVAEAKAKAAFEPHCDHCGRERPVVLATRDLSVRFGGVRAVNDVDFEIRAGQVIGIIGPNGAGKTTFFDLISGFLEPTSGRIWLNGEDVTELSADLRSARGLGRSFQDARLFPAMTVRQTISVALERHIEHRDPIASALMSGAVRLAERKVSEDVDRLIELMNLEAFADKFVGELSTGSRRIVDLACSLAHQPNVLLLDEPSSGIAQRETEALGPVLLDIRDKTGAAVVIIEHDMPLITSISDELVALELGAVVARGTPEEVINDQRVVEGYLGSTEEVIMRSGSSNGSTGRRRARRRPTGVSGGAA